jgi:hypothetical protein
MHHRPGGTPADALAGEDFPQALSSIEFPYPDQARSRPRPRPRPSYGRLESHSTVYVSRHAAEPR